MIWPEALGLDGGVLHVEGVHCLVVAVHIVLGHLHRLELLEAGLLGNLVLALVGVVFQMAHVGDVAHIAHLVADMGEIAEHQVEGHRRTGVSEMGLAIDGRAADIEAYVIGHDRGKEFFSF